MQIQEMATRKMSRPAGAHNHQEEDEDEQSRQVPQQASLQAKEDSGSLEMPSQQEYGKHAIDSTTMTHDTNKSRTKSTSRSKTYRSSRYLNDEEMNIDPDEDDEEEEQVRPGAVRVNSNQVFTNGISDDADTIVYSVMGPTSHPDVHSSSAGVPGWAKEQPLHVATAVVDNKHDVEQRALQIVEQIIAASKRNVLNTSRKRTQDSTDLEATHAVKEDDRNTNHSGCCGLTRKCMCILVGCTLSVLALAAASVPALVSSTSNDLPAQPTQQAWPSPVPTTAPSVSSATDGTSLPTLPPPTVSPSTSPYSPRFEQLYNQIGPVIASASSSGVDGTDAALKNLRSTSTKQYWALQWMADRDMATLDFSKNNMRTLVERFTMVLLYNSTNIGWWAHSLNFLSPLPTCDWFDFIDNQLRGVFCGSDGRIQHLYLQRTNLQGGLPSELALLTDLEILDMSDNRLIGTFPVTLMANLPSLWLVRLAGNGFYGRLPTEIGSMTSLVGLEIGDNDFTGTIPSEIVRLSGLIRFGIHENNLTGNVPTEMGWLRSLQSLELNRNSLSGSLPSELGGCTQLTSLQLYLNPSITGTIPLDFARLTSLESISIRGTSIEGGVEEVLCGALLSSRGEDIPYDSFYADCLPPLADVECTCCTNCCRDATTTECIENSGN